MNPALSPSSSSLLRKWLWWGALILVLAVWFATRVYVFNYFQRADNPNRHPMTRIYHDMAVSMDEGRALGEVNVSRIIRNKDADLKYPYPAEAQKEDTYCQFRTLDPGYGLVFQAARKLFYFIPDTLMRPVMLQLFMDFLLVVGLFATLYRFGWLPAVVGGVLFSTNVIFAQSMAGPWYLFWDGFVFSASMLIVMWLYRLREDEPDARVSPWVLAILLGAILGAGVWVRSSWFIFAPLFFLICLFSRHLRRPVMLAILVYGVFAGGMALRATEMNGAPSYSTRMSWHTAFQGLGRHPNVHGLEDDDLFLFDLTQRKHDVDYNLCNYRPQDVAMKTEFLALWEKDSAFVVQSISQRIFSNIFYNFNDEQHPFWNFGVLALAWAGLLLAVWRRGEALLVSMLSAGVFGAMGVAYAFVYYVTREYAYPTQMALLFGVVMAVAGAQAWLVKLWRKEMTLRPSANGVSPVTLAFAVSAMLMAFVCLPPVQKYLTPPQPVTQRWDSSDTMGFMDMLALQFQMSTLSAPQKTEMLQHMHKAVPGVAKDHDVIFEFAKAKLRYVQFINKDGTMHDFWASQHVEKDLVEVLYRSSQSILGVGFANVQNFDFKNPETWDGRSLVFELLPNKDMPPERVGTLLHEKFGVWNWELAPSEDGIHYRATYHGPKVTKTFESLSQYFLNLYGENKDASKSTKQ